METNQITVGRPINGISINGDEFLLDENNNLMTFNNVTDAMEFLRENGFDLTDEEMDEVFNFYSDGVLV